MLQFSYAGPFSDRATHARKPAKQIHVVKQSAPKTHGSLAVVLGNMADDFSEIAYRPLCEEEAVIHLGKRLRTSSIGVVRPSSASRMPSSIAARVFSSSSSSGGDGLSKSNSFALAITHDSPHWMCAQQEGVKDLWANKEESIAFPLMYFDLDGSALGVTQRILGCERVSSSLVR